MSPFAANLRGILMLMLSNFVFIVNDTLIKLASERLPTGQILVMRGSVAIAIMLIWLFLTGEQRYWRAAMNRLVAWRTFAEVAATLLYLYALFHMPLANISAINQIVPLMTTAAAAIFLGETVGWRRWIAVAIGFVGVMIIMRPGVAGFDVYAIAALGSMAFITMRDLVTRKFHPGVPTMLVTAITAGAVMLAGISISFDETWLAPTAFECVALAGAACLLLIGYGSIILAMRSGSMAVIAPFRYSVILFAIALGYVVWGDVPDAFTLIGTAIVVATGLFSFYRERQVAQEEARALARARASVSPSSA